MDGPAGRSVRLGQAQALARATASRRGARCRMRHAIPCVGLRRFAWGLQRALESATRARARVTREP
eukprot:scaffold73_cov337-Pavlova_lutheri.AAC.13